MNPRGQGNAWVSPGLVPGVEDSGDRRAEQRAQQVRHSRGAIPHEELAQRGPGPLSRAVGVSWDSIEIRLTYDRESPLFGDGHAPEGATGVLTVAAVPRRYADGVGFYGVVYPGVGLVPTPYHPV